MQRSIASRNSMLLMPFCSCETTSWQKLCVMSAETISRFKIAPKAQSLQDATQSMNESRTQTALVKSLIFFCNVTMSSFSFLFSVDSFLFSLSCFCNFTQSSLVTIIWNSQSAIFLSVEQINYNSKLKYFHYQLLIMQSRGPNDLNLNSYTSDRQENSYRETLDIQFQDQFEEYANEVKKQVQFMDKILNEISQISNSRDFITDFYPEFAVNCQYVEDDEKKAVSCNDVALNITLTNLEKINSGLKKDIQGYHFQFAKKTRLNEALISQNKILRHYLSKKNKNIQKLLHSIKNASDPELASMTQRLNELKEQNGVLGDHYKKMKEKLADKNNEEIQIAKAMDAANMKRLENEAKLKKLDDREEHSAKLTVMNTQNLREAAQRQKYLLKERERLSKLKLEYKRDQEQIIQQKNKCLTDGRQLETLKPEWKVHETNRNNLLSQFENNSERYQEQLRTNRELEQELEANKNRLTQHSIMGRKLGRKLNDYEEQYANLMKEKKEMDDHETSLMAQIDVMNVSIPQLRDQMDGSRKRVQEIARKNEEEVRAFEITKAEEGKRAHAQIMMEQNAENQKLMNQSAAIEIQNREIANLQQSLRESHAYMQSLLKEINQNQQRQAIAAQLRQRLAMAQTRSPPKR